MKAFALGLILKVRVLALENDSHSVENHSIDNVVKCPG